MNKEELQKISNKLSNTYHYLNQKEDLEKENILKAYLIELRNYSCNDIIKAIDDLSKTNKFIPTVAEIKVAISKHDSNNYNNANFNSSYWYANLKDGTPYYDITNGPDYPLQPYKD